ncbi:hypothetical protein [Mycetohabitans endofungorum]|uniref:hypothetical protein n=1 Tax=Mycetohabitans endofungorum TaxID=417203 RepID=UPI002B05A7CB|nr:hypothetical protein [Mycetohabitans endofungorum]
MLMRVPAGLILPAALIRGRRTRALARRSRPACRLAPRQGPTPVLVPVARQALQVQWLQQMQWS